MTYRQTNWQKTMILNKCSLRLLREHQEIPSSLPFQEPSFGPSWRSLAPPLLKHWSLSSFPVSVSIATHRRSVWWQHPPKLSLPVQFLQDQREVLPAKWQITCLWNIWMYRLQCNIRFVPCNIYDNLVPDVIYM